MFGRNTILRFQDPSDRFPPSLFNTTTTTTSHLCGALVSDSFCGSALLVSEPKIACLRFCLQLNQFFHKHVVGTALSALRRRLRIWSVVCMIRAISALYPEG
jgi:hypothetical protein